ncbi:hypothetical protein AKO1_007975 [Acrasis kona]|uniref:Uncharacterized protein n=1 Tax=Acrasis kona TaxID=1008807 RepID=A0AAW2YR29_9EUKA
MLLFIPPESIESSSDIKHYVSTHSVKTKKESIKDERITDSRDALMLEACHDAAFICNTNGVIKSANNAATTMFGHQTNEMIGMDITSLYKRGDELIREAITNIETLKTGLCVSIEGIKKDREEFPTRTSIGLTQFEEGSLIIVFSGDLTVEKKQKDLIAQEKKNNENLLLSILPSSVAARLKRKENEISDSIDSCTCFFSDMVGFTAMSSNMSAPSLVKLLNSIVNELDDLTFHHKIEKIKTIGDAYFCVGGLQSGDVKHAERVVRFALDAIKSVKSVTNGGIQIRVGVNTGSIVAGIIGKSKYCYDCWGDTVNLASRMESTGIPGKVQMTRSTYERVYDVFKNIHERLDVEVKGKGSMITYILEPTFEELIVG